MVIENLKVDIKRLKLYKPKPSTLTDEEMLTDENIKTLTPLSVDDINKLTPLTAEEKDSTRACMPTDSDIVVSTDVLHAVIIPVKTVLLETIINLKNYNKIDQKLKDYLDAEVYANKITKPEQLDVRDDAKFILNISTDPKLKIRTDPTLFKYCSEHQTNEGRYDEVECHEYADTFYI